MFRSIVLALILGPTLVACTGLQRVAEEYRERVARSRASAEDATTVIFLVDGLSVSFLSRALDEGRAPNLESFFAIRKEMPRFSLGRASFPTLTYPNIASILTGHTVPKHGITGNRIKDRGTILSFEDYRSWDRLAELLRGRTIFLDDDRTGRRSVSYSYPFSFDTTAHQHASLEAGLAYSSKSYDAIDQQTLLSLTTLLSDVPVRDWPRIVFVHLIAVDGVAHTLGPEDPRVGNVLADLDRTLLPVFDQLIAAEKEGRNVRVVLTADHGFAEIERAVSLRGPLSKIDPRIQVIEDNRVASIWFPSEWSDGVKLTAAQTLSEVRDVEWIARKKPNGDLELHNEGRLKGWIEYEPRKCTRGEKRAVRLRWMTDAHPADFRCGQAIDEESSAQQQGFFVTALSEFFNSPNAPDAVVLPVEHADFIGTYRGNHGGLTAKETLVPLLTRGVKLPARVLPTWRLPRELGL